MGQSKLTLSMEPEIIEKAKIYAAENNISVSKLVKNLLKDTLKKGAKKDPILEKFKDTIISPEILALTGILKGKYPEDMDYRDMKYEYLKEKYGL
ncbi:MAG: DUF6364 family protein [Bacteroidota bacterium]|nr:DUF6364 family protein [Bacteroidota bacterium]